MDRDITVPPDNKSNHRAVARLRKYLKGLLSRHSERIRALVIRVTDNEDRISHLYLLHEQICPKCNLLRKDDQTAQDLELGQSTESAGEESNL